MLQNFAKFNAIEFIALFGENNVYNIDEDFFIEGVSTDSREIRSGELFVALSGENYDGHKFIAQAFEKNAKACLVSKKNIDELLKEFPNKAFIAAKSTLSALGELAAYHRDRFNYSIIAITGSNGKTTTKEMTANVLSSKYKVLKTYANFNNQVGVPLMLLQLSDDYNIAVLELGTNSPGEIYYLTKMARPTHALVTNIGKEHLEFLDDIDGVEQEEAAVFAAIVSDGMAFINFDDERLRNYGHIISKFMTYGLDEFAKVRYEYVFNDTLNPTITIYHEKDKYEVKMKTVGLASVSNAVSAIAVATEFEVPQEDIIRLMESFEPLEKENGYGRMAVSKIGNLTFYNDTYNANPDSVLSALKSMELLSIGGKKIACLGDMKELGDAAAYEHKSILEFAEEVCDYVLLFGDEFTKAKQNGNSDKVLSFNSKDELSNKLKSISSDGDFILVKGSRSMKMEDVVNFFR